MLGDAAANRCRMHCQAPVVAQGLGLAPYGARCAASCQSRAGLDCRSGLPGCGRCDCCGCSADHLMLDVDSRQAALASQCSCNSKAGLVQVPRSPGHSAQLPAVHASHPAHSLFWGHPRPSRVHSHAIKLHGMLSQGRSSLLRRPGQPLHGDCQLVAHPPQPLLAVWAEPRAAGSTLLGLAGWLVAGSPPPMQRRTGAP